LTASHISRALTDDGRHVFFNTTEAIDPDDTNNALDVYEYDVDSGQIHLISGGADSADSYLMDASADGHDVFFVTRARLVGWDTDSAYDLYDARVGGGFPDPVPVASCSGDACQGQSPAAPGIASLGSSGFRGLGDYRPHLQHKKQTKPKRCKRGRVKRRVHGKVSCVKRKHVGERHHRGNAAKRHARSGHRRAGR